MTVWHQLGAKSYDKGLSHTNQSKKIAWEIKKKLDRKNKSKQHSQQ